MSANQVKKLNALLTRVQQRRQEPRLVAVAVAAPSANTNLAAPTLELAKPPEAPKPRAKSEDVIVPSAPSSLPPPAPPSSIPPPAASLPPPSLRTPVPAAKPSSSTVPPSERLGRAPTEVLPAAEVAPTAGVRVAASPTLPFDSAVRVTSAARVEAPKSFGDLLELSLALRPKTG